MAFLVSELQLNTARNARLRTELFSPQLDACDTIIVQTVVSRLHKQPEVSEWNLPYF